MFSYILARAYLYHNGTSFMMLFSDTFYFSKKKKELLLYGYSNRLYCDFNHILINCSALFLSYTFFKQ